MDHIRDAIMAGDTSGEEFANIEVPETFRAITVHKDEQEMFAGLPAHEKDPRKSIHLDEVPLLGSR